MPKVVGIKFRKSPKIYYFAPGNNEFTEGAGVIVETAKGQEYGTVAMLPADVKDNEVVQPLKPIVRVATLPTNAACAITKLAATKRCASPPKKWKKPGST